MLSAKSVSRSVQIATLTKQVVGLKTELLAAQCAAQHVAKGGRHLHGGNRANLPEKFSSAMQRAQQWIQSQADDRELPAMDGTPGKMLLLLGAVIFAALCMFLLIPRFM